MWHPCFPGDYLKCKITFVNMIITPLKPGIFRIHMIEGQKAVFVINSDSTLYFMEPNNIPSLNSDLPC